MSPKESSFQVRAAAALADPKFRWKQLLPFLGPSFIASVAYMDPGNFATNISGGAGYGYALLWVILAANFAAMFIQYQSAKLGVVTGRNLPEVIRDRSPRAVTLAFWIQGELVAMATDLAEFLGAALALHLLTGMPLLWGAVVAGVASFALLGLQRWGFRPLEAAITAFVGVIAFSYVIQFFLAKPDGSLWAGFLPGFKDTGMLYIAVGILGATVMPHVIYLHSALTQHRIPTGSPQAKRKMLLFTKIEILLALGVAGLINMAMLAAAAGAFFGKGIENAGDLTVAYQTLTPLLGPLAAGAFAVALLASGLSSSTVGTLSGQVIMQGFVNFRIPIWIRRGVTMIPAFVVILLGADPTQALVLSQVVLSFGIPFALVPLLLFVGNKTVMGEHANRGTVQAVGWFITAVIVGLNFYLLGQTLLGAGS
jgi:manganese transport protein